MKRALTILVSVLILAGCTTQRGQHIKMEQPPVPSDESGGLRLAIPSADCTVEPKIHIVKKGETLSYIARQYGVTVRALVIVNDLKNPNLIQIGKQLYIPDPEDQ